MFKLLHYAFCNSGCFRLPLLRVNVSSRNGTSTLLVSERCSPGLCLAWKQSKSQNRRSNGRCPYSTQLATVFQWQDLQLALKHLRKTDLFSDVAPGTSMKGFPAKTAAVKTLVTGTCWKPMASNSATRLVKICQRRPPSHILAASCHS